VSRRGAAANARSGGGIEFEPNVFSSAQAGVDREDDVQRQLGFAIENSDVLWLTVFGDGKVFLRKARDRRSPFIDHRREYAD